MGDLTHKAIDGIRAELAAQVERTNDWRARAKQAEIETSEQRTRAEAAEAELRELRKLVDAWKAADEDRANWRESRCGEELLQQLLEEAEEALRHG